MSSGKEELLAHVLGGLAARDGASTPVKTAQEAVALTHVAWDLYRQKLISWTTKHHYRNGPDPTIESISGRAKSGRLYDIYSHGNGDKPDGYSLYCDDVHGTFRSDLEDIKDLAETAEHAAIARDRELAAQNTCKLATSKSAQGEPTQMETKTTSAKTVGNDSSSELAPRGIMARAAQQLLSEAKRGGRRAKASTLSEQTQRPVFVALRKAGVPRPGLLWFESRLKTPLGSAAWDFALGSVIPFIPKVAERPSVQALGSELRTQGFHKVLHGVAKAILDPIGDVLIAFVEGDDESGDRR